MQQILIFCTAEDVTASKVIAWIRSINKNIDVIRINDDDSSKGINFTDSSGALSLSWQGKLINLHSSVHIWYRNGTLFSNEFLSESIDINHISQSEFHLYLDYLGFYLNENFQLLGSILEEKYLNKLVVMSKAQKAGLLTPRYYLSNNNVPNLSYKAIVKSIGNIRPFVSENNSYHPNYTIHEEGSNNQTSLSYVQEYIEKSFEVRSFFLEQKFYSMAIFSQQSDKTKIDYRNYDEDKPNRKVPFSLPEEVKNKLINLMSTLNLKTGSIDLIVTQHNEFYFLEVNPCGQIDWLGESCNYYLEKIIANYLLND